MSYELRRYQLDAVAAIGRELERVRSTLLVLATGCGKTVTFSALARDIVGQGGRVLVLAHRSELLEQAAATLRRLGLRAGIEQAARSVGPLECCDVIVGSVATLQRSRLRSYEPDAFRLVVVDEAHHAPAASYRNVLDYFASAKVLGVTATPDRGDGVGLRAVFESLAYRYELREAIAEGWLAPLEVRAVAVQSLDLSSVRVRAGELAAEELEAELMRDSVLHEIAGPLAELAAGRQTLAFTASVAQAHALAEVLRGRGLRAAAVDGSTPPEQRAQVLEDYRAGRLQLVANAMLWTEGFDDPQTSCIALVRPTTSRALVAQMIGRGTRTAPGKASCLVLDFVPGRMAKVRLASPADVLAGDELEAEAERERQTEAKQRLAAEVERRRWIREVGVVYAAPLLSLEELLGHAARSGPPASERQVAALRAAGIPIDRELSRTEAAALFGLLEERRAAGLCTLKQARMLRRYGLPDDVSYEQASAAIDQLARGGWRRRGARRAAHAMS